MIVPLTSSVFVQLETERRHTTMHVTPIDRTGRTIQYICLDMAIASYRS